MKRILLAALVYCSFIGMGSSQETVSPFYKGDFESGTISDLISSNDIFSMDGEVVKLKDKATLAYIKSDEIYQHNMLHPDEFALNYVLIIYPEWYVDQNNVSKSGSRAVIYFPNTNGWFDNNPSQRGRFYKVADDGKIDDAIMKKLMKWAEESGINSSFEMEDSRLWHWFYMEAEFKITISSDASGNKKAVLTREVPQYFLINYQDK